MLQAPGWGEGSGSVAQIYRIALSKEVTHLPKSAERNFRVRERIANTPPLEHCG